MPQFLSKCVSGQHDRSTLFENRDYIISLWGKNIREQSRSTDLAVLNDIFHNLYTPDTI